MNNDSMAIKSGVWYTASNFLVKSIGFITTPVFTRLLTKEEFGIFNNYISWLSLITIFVTLNLHSTLISARYDFKKKFDEYILSMVSLSTISALLWLFLSFVFQKQLSVLLGLEYHYILAMLVYLIFSPIVEMFQTRERYSYEYKKSVLISLVLSLGTALLSVVLVLSMSDKLRGRIIGATLPTVIVGGGLFIFFVKRGKFINVKYWQYAIPIAIPYVPHLLAGTVLNSTDRVMINYFCGASDTALYSLAYNCGTMVVLLMSSINSAFAPWLGEKLSESKYSEIRRFTKMYILGFMGLAIGIMLISPEILFVLGGKDYMEAVYVMAPVSMGCICQFLYTLFVNVEQFYKKTRGMAVASVIAAILNMGLNWLFIPRVGYLAAAYTTLAGYICLLLIHMYLVKIIRMDIVYSYRFVAFVIMIGFVAMFIVIFTYSYNILRYILICLYCIVLFWGVFRYKNRLISFVKKK